MMSHLVEPIPHSGAPEIDSSSSTVLCDPNSSKLAVYSVFEGSTMGLKLCMVSELKVWNAVSAAALSDT